MFSFMFGVLFSVTFWAVYIPVSFVIAIGLVKSIYPSLLNPIMKGTNIFGGKKDSGTIVFCLIQLFFIMVFWPILIILVAGYYLFKSLMTKFIVSLLKSAVDKIPSIKVTFDGESKDKKDPVKPEE